MITKDQFNKFLASAKLLRSKGYKLIINDQPVIKIGEEALYTTNYYKENGSYIRVRYSHEDSIKPYMTMKDLYSKVSFMVTMQDACRGDLASEQMYQIEFSMGDKYIEEVEIDEDN